MSRRKKRDDGLMQKFFRVNIKGVSKSFIVYGHTEMELLEKEMAKRAEIEKGLETVIDPTVSEYYERWADSRRGIVSEATLRTQDKFMCVILGQRVDIAGSVVALFGDVKLKAVDINILRSLQAALRDGRKSQTVNDYMALVKHLFSDAMKERIIDYNPCVLISNLKRTEEKARDTKHRALTMEETRAFFGCKRCRDSYYYNVFVFALNTGMRIGEIGALKYSDIRKGNIYVERTITRTETGQYIVGESAKTAAGRRIIPLNKEAAGAVDRQKAMNEMLEGCILTSNNLLFPSPERGLLLSTPINRDIKRICKECGVAEFSMHALRDTFATRAIESGMNPKTLQEIMGHANFNITMSLYGHCLENTKREEMDAVLFMQG